ncbi:unnamed protein product [Absidia cylindrospora]
MISHQIRFENNNDKHIDYNLLLDTSYYTSPTLSTPLSSPTNSLIQDEMPLNQHRNLSSVPMTTHQQGNYVVSPGNTSHPQQDDWLLGQFYDPRSFIYNPLVPLDSADANHTGNVPLQSILPIVNYSNHHSVDDFQSMMAITGGSVGTVTAPGTLEAIGQQNNHTYAFNNQQIEKTKKSATEPVSSASSPLAKSKKKSSKKTPVPYAHQMRSLNFGYPSKACRAYSSPRSLSSTSSPTQPHSTPSSFSSPSSATNSPSTTLHSGKESALQKGKNKKQASSPYQCDFPGCQKTFTRPYNLKSHHRTHTNEKPFECPHCNKSFARQHDRNRHAKLHFGIKPYVCVYCYKAFARQDALTRHQIWVDENGVIGCSSLKRKSRKGSAV